MHQQPTAFENIVGKGEIARNEQFLLFPECFLQLDNCILISPYFDIKSLFAAESEEPKNWHVWQRVKRHFGRGVWKTL